MLEACVQVGLSASINDLREHCSSSTNDKKNLLEVVVVDVRVHSEITLEYSLNHVLRQQKIKLGKAQGKTKK